MSGGGTLTDVNANLWVFSLIGRTVARTEKEVKGCIIRYQNIPIISIATAALNTESKVTLKLEAVINVGDFATHIEPSTLRPQPT